MTPRHGLSEIVDYLVELPVEEKAPVRSTPIPTGESTIDTWNAAHGADWVAEMLTNTGRWLPVRGQYPNRAGEWHVDFIGSSTPGTSAVIYPDGHITNFSETAASELPWIGVRQKHDAVDIAVHLHHGGDRDAWMAEARELGFGAPKRDVDAEIDEWLAEINTSQGEGNGAGDWWISDIASFLAGTYDPPVPTVLIRNDGSGVFYAERVNMVFGESGSGKSWLALQATKEEIEHGGTVIYLDWEDTLAGVAGRLLSMGTDRDLILDRFIHVKPQAKYSEASRAMIRGLIADRGVTLVVVDSTGEAMALDGAKPNDDDETARWFKALPQWIADQGVTVILVDHVPKANEGGGPRMQSIGSQRKRAAVTGLSLSLEVLSPPSKGQSGKLKGVCAKDRHGTYAQKSTVAIIDLLSRDDGDRVEIVVREPDERDISQTAKRVAQDVFLFIKTSDRPSKSAIEKGVTGKASAIRTAIDMLVERGNIAVDPGSGRFLAVRDFDLEVDWVPGEGE